jgi:hypothetical protein
MGYWPACHPAACQGILPNERHPCSGGSQQVLQNQIQRLTCSLGMLLLIASMQPGDWSTSDKTTVDLENAPSVTAINHAHPRGARHYRHDETEVDLSTPLPASETRQTAPEPTPVEAPGTVPAQEEPPQ